MQKLLNPFCKYKIYIIEQSDDNNKFNIGKLKNIGFEIATSESNYNNYIFTDIDILPDNKLIHYYDKDINGFIYNNFIMVFIFLLRQLLDLYSLQYFPSSGFFP